MEPNQSFSEKVKKLIKSIPKGKVATYGQIAAMAGSPLGARQVVRILHSSSRKENLPWHRIINGSGKISLPHGAGYEEQKALLMKEGIRFDKADQIDLEHCRFQQILPGRPRAKRG
jgi:methylated-DNA-protein-cysteine methyltransferase-like protein